jgi:DNA-binding CsgD family transcriptional regulator
VRLGLRLAAGSHDWTEVTVVLATTSPDDPPPLAFAVICDDLGADPPAEGTRQMQLETHMLRIADELRAAGMIPRLEQLPALTEIPQLGDLTSREWEVLTGLLNGQRVSDIAAELYVSQSTVRNHLSSIYARLGVHSQVDLVRLIRQGTKQPAGNPQDE